MFSQNVVNSWACIFKRSHMAIQLSPSLTFGSKVMQFFSASSLWKLVISSNSRSSYVYVVRKIKQNYLPKWWPLVRFWTMRFEGKHCYLKTLAQSIGNFINVAWTLVNCHQQWQCDKWLDSRPLGQELPEIGPG